MPKLPRSIKTTQTRCGLSIAASLMLLSGCATVQNACPNLPEAPVKAELGPSFQDLMRDFLSGKLPEPMSLDQPSEPATNGSTK